jgi:hypothetical protein
MELEELHNNRIDVEHYLMLSGRHLREVVCVSQRNAIYFPVELSRLAPRVSLQGTLRPVLLSFEPCR